MPAQDFMLAVKVSSYSYIGEPMGKFTVYGNQRKGIRESRDKLLSLKKRDEKDPPENPKHPHIVVFDPSIEGLEAARDLVLARLDDLLAKT
jgi:hypothetical protein